MRVFRRARDERGSQVVELAVVMPFVLLVLLAIVDFGKAFNYWQTNTQVAASGARAGAVNHWPAGETLQQYIRTQITATNELRQRSQICVAFPDGNSNVGSRIEVKIKVDYPLPLVNSFGVAPPLHLRGGADNRIEVAPDATLGNRAISPADNIPTGATCA
jgi:hypothetical protein